MSTVSFYCDCDYGFTYLPTDLPKSTLYNLICLFIIYIFEACDLDPCVNGECIDTSVSFFCDCNYGYTGPICEYESKILIKVIYSLVHLIFESISQKLDAIGDFGYKEWHTIML